MYLLSAGTRTARPQSGAYGKRDDGTPDHHRPFHQGGSNVVGAVTDSALEASPGASKNPLRGHADRPSDHQTFRVRMAMIRVFDC